MYCSLSSLYKIPKDYYSVGISEERGKIILSLPLKKFMAVPVSPPITTLYVSTYIYMYIGIYVVYTHTHTQNCLAFPSRDIVRVSDPTQPWLDIIFPLFFHIIIYYNNIIIITILLRVPIYIYNIHII